MEISEADGIVALVELLMCSENHANCNAAAALRYVMDPGGKVLAQRFMDAGGLEPLVDLTLTSNSEASEHAARIFRLISLEKSTERRKAMFDAGSVAALARLLHKGNPPTKGDAARALHNLSDNASELCEESVTKELIVAMVEAGLIVPVVELLRSDNSDAHLASLSILVQIVECDDKAFLGRIVDAGGLEVLVMQMSSGGPDERDEAVVVLNFILGEPKFRKAAAEAGCIVPMVKILGVSDNFCHYYLVAALDKLAREEDLKEALVVADSLSALVQMLRSDHSDLTFYAACCFLRNLAKDATMKRREAILTAGSIAPLAEMLKNSYQLDTTTSTRSEAAETFAHLSKPDLPDGCSFYQSLLAEMDAAGWNTPIDDMIKNGNAAAKERAERVVANMNTLRASSKSLAASNFKKLYDECRPPQKMHELLLALDTFIDAALEGMAASDRQDFFHALQHEAVSASAQKGNLSEVQAIATRLWSSTLRSTNDNREMCSYINQALREDQPKMLESLVVIIRAINELCVNRRTASSVDWPKDHTCYRGAGLPDERRGFFRPGRKYRVPFLLATTFEKTRVAQGIFASQAQDNGFPPVLYVLRLDAEYQCRHVNFLGEKSLCNESEFLFAPYSVFTVRSVEWQETPTWRNPHMVHLDVAVDNKEESDDLPLAFWH
ncbi:unnamed protein product [Polarella glacialis]|nr:unnamed protein product [Polarella glacialis]